MAIDEQGRPLALSPEEVQSVVATMIDQGKILAIITTDQDGDIAVAVMGEPSQAIVDALETTLTAYRRMLLGH